MTDLRHVRNFETLIHYLEEELDWPLDGYEMEDLTFDYEPADLGLKAEDAAAVKSIKQLRPLNSQQPWGIFFIEFDKKKLPVVVLRCILSHLVFKKRASANRADRAAWNSHDLLFISAFGPEDEAGREIGFAHFHEESGDLPSLRVLGWDGADTTLKLQTVASALKERLRWPEKGETVDAWRERWSRAFRHRPGHVIKTSDMLAEALAALAKRIRDAAQTKIKHETESGPLRSLHRAFQTNLIHDLTEDGFADTYAQTITYGLLTAAINRTDMAGGRHGTFVKADDVSISIKPTSPFLKEMLETFLKVGGRKGLMDFDELGVQDVVELLRSDVTDIPAILADFGNRTRGEDPVIHFYEHFLGAYNKQLKIQRGVFYTPQPVVSYIVRSVHELLQTEFGLEDGLADTTTWGEFIQKSSISNPESPISLPPLTDQPGETRTISPDEPFVQILDPATGTATFLVEVIDVIHRTLKEKWKKGGTGILPVIPTPHGRDAHAPFKTFAEYWNHYVPTHLLPRLHGYELMMAPYAIAHMKIGLKLTELGYEFRSDARARIYLTNALEPWMKQLPLIGFDALAHEAAAVNEIKRHKRFTVVIGNPPYAVSSHNKSPFIEKLMSDYKTGLERERNIQPLSDDYIKFICLGEHLINTTNQGILGFITNHSYLGGVIHRTMRKSLMTSFDRIAVTDLHGNSFINEHPPAGIRDSNVFEIQQGVSLFLGCRKNGFVAEIAFSELWGTGASKLDILAGPRQGVTHTTIFPDTEYAFFVPKDFSQSEDYSKWTSLADVFGINQNGIQTGHDGFSVAFDRVTVIQHVEDFCDAGLSDSEVSQRYDLGDNSGWSFVQKRRQLRGSAVNAKLLVPYFYRPFDLRHIYYDPNLLKRPSPAIMPHLVDGKNMALFAMRKIVPTFAYSFFGVVNSVVDHGHFYMGNQGSSSCFPLYLKPTQQRLGTTSNREHNLQSRFCEQLSKTLGMAVTVDCLPAGFTPEDIFHYIYAVFHSPSYRSRYAEFLKIDFPRLPLTGKLELFRALARLGGELTALHLLESPKLNQPITEFIGSSKEITKVGYTDNTVWINAGGTKGKNTAGSSGFHGVPEAVWNFHIGGYQVCEKWLKDRKGRTLSAEDIAHYHKIVVALSETIRLMAEIDEVIAAHGGWPGAFQPKEA